LANVNVNVWLKNPLSQKYVTVFPSLEYAYLGDPRNWLAQYMGIETGAMVTAKCQRVIATPLPSKGRSLADRLGPVADARIESRHWKLFELLLVQSNKALPVIMSRGEMNLQLKAQFVPALRRMGFKGTLPHFRRQRDNKVDLLTMQFDRRGCDHTLRTLAGPSCRGSVTPNSSTAPSIVNQFCTDLQ
jgi:hypothetical protein